MEVYRNTVHESTTVFRFLVRQSKTVTMVQVSATFVPMQFNTALGFLLSGLGLLAITRGYRGTGVALGIFLLLVGLLTPWC